MKWAILLMGVLSLVLGYALNIPDLLMLSVILYAAAVILDRSDDLEESMKEKEERIMRRIKDLEDILKFVPTENANFSLKTAVK